MSTCEGRIGPGGGPGRGLARGSARGFSLIELLVVISIISVLMGIIVTVLPKVRQSALRVACSSNLKQIGYSIEMYLSDNALAFPEAKYMPDPWLSGVDLPGLNDAISEHLEPDSEVWICPGDDVVHSITYETEDGRQETGGVSYTYITGLSGVTFEQSFYARFLQRTPQETPVAHDYDGGTFETQDGRMIQADFFHDTRNILYVDGHVSGPVETGGAG